MIERNADPSDERASGGLFVLQAVPRCGSHMIRTALARHPDLRCLGEVFNVAARANRQTGIHRHATARRPLEMLREQYGDRPRWGFIAQADIGLPHFGHARPYADLWGLIPAGTLVINIRRRNLLHRYVSHGQADRSGRWQVYLAWRRPRIRPLVLDAEEVRRDFRRIREVERIADARFPDAISIYYEDACRDIDREIGRILAHLGLPGALLRPGTIKTGCDMRRAVANYDEIASSFRESEFAPFFDE
jgi:hypothetical protein